MNEIFTQILHAVRRPSRLHLVFDHNARRLMWLRLRGVSREFEMKENSVFSRRAYKTYGAYLAHQSSKLDMLSSGSKFGLDGTDLLAYDEKFRIALRERLQSSNLVAQGMSTLCLAARVGSEVKAFHDLGCFAVGIDLNPGPKNEYVLHGDFHSLVFPDKCVDIVYTNSFDHAFDLTKLLREVRRVLCPDGWLIAEIQLGENDGGRINTATWESLTWKSTGDMEAEISRSGFAAYSRTRFDIPWDGVQVMFRPVSA